MSHKNFQNLSSHSCNFGIFIDWCPYLRSAKCIHKLRVTLHVSPRRYASRQTQWPLDDVVRDKVTAIPLHQYQQDNSQHWGRGGEVKSVSRSSSFVYCTTIPPELRPVAHCLSRLHLTTCLTTVTQETGDEEKERWVHYYLGCLSEIYIYILNSILYLYIVFFFQCRHMFLWTFVVSLLVVAIV